MAFQNADERSSVEISSEFIGWHVAQQTVAVSCQPGIPWTTNDNGFGGCCPSPDASSGCPLRTDCVSNTGLWDNGESSACGEGRGCRTMHVYEEYIPGSWASSSVKAIMCVSTTWSWDTVFHRVAEATEGSTESSIASSTATSGSESSPESTPSSTGTSTNSESSSTSSSTALPGTDDGDDDGGGSSQAWIAGAVIGPIFLIAALVLGIWWYKRHSAKKAAAAELASGGPGNNESAPAMAYNNYYNDPNQQQQQQHYGGYAQGQQPYSQQSTPYQQDAHGGYYNTPPPGPHAGWHQTPETYTSELDSSPQVKPAELPAQYR